MDLKGRDFLTLKDYTPEEILYLIYLAAELKDKKEKGYCRTATYRKECCTYIREDKYKNTLLI